MEKGRIAERGSYAELMARDGLFAALVREGLTKDQAWVVPGRFASSG